MASLEDKTVQLFQTFKSSITIGCKFTFNLCRFSFTIFIFFISCGTLARLRKRESKKDSERDRSSSSDAFECEDTSNDPRYQVQLEMGRKLPRSESRLKLTEMIQQHQFSRKDSWGGNYSLQQDIIIIPSLSLDNNELSKITAASFYEHRQLCTLFYLMNPRVRLVYCSSIPIDKSILKYYLTLIEENSTITAQHAYKRLLMLSCNDNQLQPLTSKILRRPKLIQRIKNWINPENAFINCFISSNLERDLALQIGVPLLSNDPMLAFWGTKLGSREIFAQAQVPLPDGSDLVYSVDELVEQIQSVYVRNKMELRKIVVKLNIGFSGEGNAMLYTDKFDKNNLKESIKKSLREDLKFVYQLETWDSFQQKLHCQGALAEHWVDNVVCSPSAQCIINPDGQVEMLSTHEQMLGGDDGMVYLGCEFPARDEYRKLLLDYSMKIGEILASKGCRDRFAIDYVVREVNGQWEAFAIEINLRWGGTSHPMIFAKHLTNSMLTPDGLLMGADGLNKYYVATDNVQNDIYTGLNPEDFLDFVNQYPELQFNSERITGVVFHLLQAIPVFGKFGFVAIGNSREEAMQIYERTIQILQEEAEQIAQRKDYFELDLKMIRPDTNKISH